jgi:hypothetical protein
MGTLTILCTETGCQVSTGVYVDRRGLNAMATDQRSMRCRACGGEHRWSKRWATLMPVMVRSGETVEPAVA